jgi:prepilin-type N-terminal cleavage/methylation domain-containing protein
MTTLLRTSRAPLAARDERGHTLIEMMVATALLSVVLAAAFGSVIAMQNQATKTTDRFTAIGEAQTIADRITKDIRTAVAPSATSAAFASASANDLTFYASLSDPNGPTKLHASTSIVPGTNVAVFHEDATAPDPNGSAGNYTYSGSPVTRLDGRFIDTTQAMFRFYDSDNNVISAAELATTAGLRSIDQVDITLRVRVHPSSPSVVISTRVHVRSVDYDPNS